MNLNDFLNFLIYSGGSVAVMSFIAERWAWFQSLVSEKKQLYSFIGSASIAIVSYAFLTYAPAGFIEAMTPYFTILASVFGVYYLGQAFHAEDKLPLK